MPFLNGEAFIREAIDSVLSQTFKDWELLLADDGSSDASTEIAIEFATRFSDKVRYLDILAIAMRVQVRHATSPLQTPTENT